jgi:hypothetical protein
MPLRAKHSCLCKVKLGYKPSGILDNEQIKDMGLDTKLTCLMLTIECEVGDELKVQKINTLKALKL